MRASNADFRAFLSLSRTDGSLSSIRLHARLARGLRKIAQQQRRLWTSGFTFQFRGLGSAILTAGR